MANSSSTAQIDHAVATYGLSKRAARNSLQDLPWDSLEKTMANLWEPGNPDGLVFLGVAENPLLHDEVIKHIESHFAITAGDHLGYGVGPRGSPRLRKAMAEFFTSNFKAHEPVLPEQVLVLPGVVAVLDALSWAICDEEEGILVPLPFYTGFKPAVGERARGRIIPASFRQIKGYLGLDDVFDPHMNRQALEGALRNAANDGVKARAVILSNPHNPLGRCYPAETLKEVARFCGRHNLHLISDEIFADSVYDNEQAPNLAAFTSILALDLGDYIDPRLVHVAYGMSKDFGATGLRVGTLHSRNEGLIAAVTSIWYSS
ncbi:putative pyridoxal phosphate-dependent major subdomain 2 [Rosellinia necatrix]|uniref:Putative pyridoxal phosphate-dependent major subdomain 2 n=1 Tax=Rosellinia necatrix TaxID=77044 RepID=A0A1S8A8P5_ROSNE|nr:putative pyridoxal phosphate-dependent major subdomain 2 [Rosellinia necatrix]